MSLKHALMIALQENKGTGYEITKWFQEGPGHFWHATHQQIYRELAKLSQEGLVSFVDVPQTGKPGKKVYEVTGNGKRELVNWLLQPTPSSPLKDSLLMKIYAGHLIPVENLLEEMKQARKANENNLSTFHEIEEQVFTAENMKIECMQYAHLTLRNGIIMITAWLMWADEVIAFLEKRLATNPATNLAED